MDGGSPLVVKVSGMVPPIVSGRDADTLLRVDGPRGPSTLSGPGTTGTYRWE